MSNSPAQELGLRERKKARLRERILRTSTELFQRRGYHETRVADIVEALEISQPTFFRYFPSKDAVLREVLIVSLKQYRAALAPQEKAECKEERAATTIAYALKILAAWTRRNRSLMLAFVESGALGLESDTVRPWREPSRPGTRAALFSLRAIRDGQARGDLRRDLSAEALGQFLGASVIQVLYDWCARDDPDYDLEVRLREMADCFMHGAEIPRAQEQL